MNRRRLPIDADHPAYDPGSCGPDGYPQCRRCLAEVHDRRDGFCSATCRHDFLIRTSASYARNAVFARDRGICTHCRLNCWMLDRVIRRLCAWAPETDPEAGRSLALRMIHLLGFGVRRTIISMWQADHRVAIAEGGVDCGLGNYRTLCLICHAFQMRELHRRTRLKRDDVPW